MFGQLGILKRRLGCARPAYQAHFCASCHLMAEFGGKPASLWMNYDLTFLSVLLSSLEGPGEARPAACTALPWRKVRVAPLPVWGRRALAALNLALLSAKLEDDRQDERGLTRRLAGAWVAAYQRRVDQVLGDTGFPLAIIRALPHRQALVEQARGSLGELSQPTADTIGAILEHVGDLSGRPERRSDLGRLGQVLGRFLYYLDAAQDFAEDARKGRFNALAACWGPAWQEARAATLLHGSLEELTAALRRFADLEPLGSLIDPLLDSLADRLPVHGSWVPSWRRLQAGDCNCDCGGGDCSGCDGCCGSGDHSGCCTGCCDSSHGGCCHSGSSHSGCCAPSDPTVDCCCMSCECCGEADVDDAVTTSSAGAAAASATSVLLLCPGCRSPLKPQKVGKVEVDQCPACAGLWLDRHELKALAKMRSLPGWLLEPVSIVPDRPLVPEGERRCPRCEALLQVADNKGVRIDLCRSCEGVYFDRGELNQVLRS